MSARQLFVLVSTGQNVANLPPVLERAGAGDLVVWVESAVARARNWSTGARRVLEAHGLKTLSPDIAVEQVNDPVEVARASQSVVNAWRGKDVRPLLVANGGGKLTPIGLLRAWEALNPVVLYGEEQPVGMRTFEGGLGQPAAVRPYSRHRLDLADVLLASGHTFANDAAPVRLWPAPDEPPASVHDERYAGDAAYSGGLHAAHHAWATGMAAPGTATVPFGRLAALLPAARLDRWRRSLGTLARSGDVDNPAIQQEVYNATANLVREAERASGRQLLIPPPARLGDAMERAVARRVVDWVAASAVAVVQSVWMNVAVARAERPEQRGAEFDVLVVLKNAVLLHLECKTAAVDQKDLDARLLNLQRAGSQLARMALCVPVFTSFAAEPWFAGLHAVRQRLEAADRLTFLPLTLPGQPDSYSVPAEAGVVMTYPVVPFEQALARFLRPYQPAAPGAV